jgi:serine/threonine-protein kinase
VSASERYSILATIEPLAGWRRVLAFDRSGATPRAVVLAFVPEKIAGDGTRLATVVRDVEAAARLHHAGAVPVLGMETVGEALAVVEPYLAGTSLRSLLASGGRLPPDVAGRVVVDACAAIAHAHSLDAGDRLPLVHGALEPGRISVGRDGGVAVCGFGMAGFASVADDVRGLATILYECLAGEPPPEPPRVLDVPGIPAALAAAVSRAIGAAPGGPFASAGAFAGVIAAAGPLASHAAVASYAEAILPSGEGRRAELFAALEGVRPSRQAVEVISEDLIVEPTGPAARPPARLDAPPLAPSRPAPDAATTFRAPPPAAARRSLAPFAVAAACAAAGFALGFVASRFVPGAFVGAPPPAIPAAPAVAAPSPDGTAHAQGAIPPAAPKGQPSRPSAPAVRKAAKAAKAGKAARRASAPQKGMLDVTAPADAEVFLDGRRVGKGSVRLPVAEGAHRIEVRLGPARVAERFTLAPGETWTYAVAPTVQ